MDMSKVTYTVSTSSMVKTFTNSTATLSWVKQNTPVDPGQTTYGGLLNAREMVLVTIQPGFTSAQMGTNTPFIVEVNPPVGAALPIARTIPAGMTANTWYEVY